MSITYLRRYIYSICILCIYLYLYMCMYHGGTECRTSFIFLNNIIISKIFLRFPRFDSLFTNRRCSSFRYLLFFCQFKRFLGKVKYRPSNNECERDSWIFLDNFSTSFWWNSVIKIARWFKLINSSNHLAIFLVEFRRKLVEKLSKKIVRLCRPFTLP